MRTLLATLLMLAAFTAYAQGIWPSLDFAVAVRGLMTEVRIKEPMIPTALPMPEYPTELARAGISGEASVRFFVKADGSVGEVQIVASSQSEFRAPVTEAIRRWRFQAYSPDGTQRIEKPAWMTCRVLFRHEEE